VHTFLACGDSCPCEPVQLPGRGYTAA